MDEEATPKNTPRYDMRDRNLTANRRQSSSNRKNINYSDHNTRENKQDSDYEPVQLPPIPLNNKRYPCTNRVAMQQEILLSKTKKCSNTLALPDATKNELTDPKEPKLGDNMQVDKPESPVPTTPNEKTEETPSRKNSELPEATENPVTEGSQQNSDLATSDSSNLSLGLPKSDRSDSEKTAKGVFKTKTISIRCANDPRTFKCSQCDKHMNTLRELNAHFIANHHKVQCDICAKSFNTPGALRKHRYTYVEEKSQYKCRTCSKMFPFESQLKSHCHVHCHSRNYICASANCGKSFKHPGDLSAHAKSHGDIHKCAHCNYSNSDIRNLKSHLCTHSRNAPFKCKLCDARFVHSNLTNGLNFVITVVLPGETSKLYCIV